jgi:hypothetical protein
VGSGSEVTNRAIMLIFAPSKSKGSHDLQEN